MQTPTHTTHTRPPAPPAHLVHVHIDAAEVAARSDKHKHVHLGPARITMAAIHHMDMQGPRRRL